MIFFHKIKDRFEQVAQKSKIPTIQNTDSEQIKLSILRIIIGIIVFIRNFEIVYAAPYMGYTDNMNSEGIICLCIIFLFTIGLFTPITSIVLFMTYVFRFSAHYGTNTLGDTTFIQLLTVLIFLNHGSKLSIDSWLLKQNNFISTTLKYTYSLIGFPKTKDFKTIYFYGFCAYALVSFGAFLYHVTDPHWIKGYTVHALLVNAYLCKYSNFFREIENISPLIMQLNSYIGLIGQSIFQLFMVVLIFFRWGKIFVQYWGWIFFILSLIFIQLSYLPHIEIILWIAIFHRFKFKKIEKYTYKLPSHLSFNYKLYPAIFFYLIISVLYVSTKYRLINRVTYRILGNEVTSKISWYIYAMGYDLPIVFNQTDLALGNNWLFLEQKNDSGYNTIPFSNIEGKRLPYFTGIDHLFLSNHGSDILYYRTILQQRRNWGIEQHITGKVEIDSIDINYAKKLATFDYKYQHYTEPIIYRATFYTSQSNDMELLHTERYKKTVLKTVEFTIKN